MKRKHKSSYLHYCEVLGTLETSANVDIRLDCELQLERERKSAEEFPEFYKLADVMDSGEGQLYRSGEFEGERYMTNDDYSRLILEKTKIPQYVMGAASSHISTPRPAAA